MTQALLDIALTYPDWVLFLAVLFVAIFSFVMGLRAQKTSIVKLVNKDYDECDEEEELQETLEAIILELVSGELTRSSRNEFTVKDSEGSLISVSILPKDERMSRTVLTR